MNLDDEIVMYEKGNKSKVILVGLVGYPGSGRTAVSNYLYYSYGFIRINMMDKVEEVAKVLGKKDIKSMLMLKRAITDVFGEDVWLRLLERRMEEEIYSRLIDAYSVPGVTEASSILKVVIGDIENSNEFEFVKGRDGLLIGLLASKKTLYDREKNKTHLSFQEFKKSLRYPTIREIPSLIKRCDFVINTNNITISTVEERVDEIIKKQFLGELSI